MKVTVDGVEREVVTAEEAEEKSKEEAEKAVEAYKAEHPDQTAAIDTLKSDLDKAKKDLEAAEAQGNSGQVTRLRKERDEAEQKLSAGITKITDEFASFRKELMGDVQEQVLQRLVGNNKEMREKVLFEFARYNPNATTKIDIEERLNKAYQIVSGGRPAPKFTDNISGSGPRGDGYNPAPEKNESENGTAMRRALGISDEQYKKGLEVLKKIGK